MNYEARDIGRELTKRTFEISSSLGYKLFLPNPFVIAIFDALICYLPMIGSAIIAFLWSGVKYLIGATLCMVTFSNPILGFLVSTAGALAGIFVFTYGGLWIESKLEHRFFAKGKHFNKRTRLLVRMKRSGGLPLVALLTPVFLSIPIGCIMATAFIHSRKKIVFFMTLSVLFWGIIIFGSALVFHLNLADAMARWAHSFWDWLTGLFNP
jgi:hypothetical protein